MNAHSGDIDDLHRLRNRLVSRVVPSRHLNSAIGYLRRPPISLKRLIIGQTLYVVNRQRSLRNNDIRYLLLRLRYKSLTGELLRRSQPLNSDLSTRSSDHLSHIHQVGTRRIEEEAIHLVRTREGYTRTHLTQIALRSSSQGSSDQLPLTRVTPIRKDHRQERNRRRRKISMPRDSTLISLIAITMSTTIRKNYPSSISLRQSHSPNRLNTECAANPSLQTIACMRILGIEDLEEVAIHARAQDDP